MGAPITVVTLSKDHRAKPAWSKPESPPGGSAGKVLSARILCCKRNGDANGEGEEPA
jgi:hypothetical protein